MKHTYMIVLLAALAAAPAWAGARATHALSAGARVHSTHPAFPEIPPYGDGDVSYGVAYEYHEPTGYWQIACNYAPDVLGTPTNQIDSVVTPSLNLVFTDKGVLAGVGVLRSYVTTDEGSEWSAFYYQFLAGFRLPLLGMNLNINAYYVFDDWSDLNEFDFGDLEYGAWATWSF